jgi:hypothetical protein
MAGLMRIGKPATAALLALSDATDGFTLYAHRRSNYRSRFAAVLRSIPEADADALGSLPPRTGGSGSPRSQSPVK